MALFMGITFKSFFFSTANQRIEVFDDYWSFLLKLGGHFALVFPTAMTSLFGYLFNPVCSFFPPLDPETSLQLTIKNTGNKYKIAIKLNRLRFKIEIYVYISKLNYKKNIVHKYTITN